MEMLKYYTDTSIVGELSNRTMTLLVSSKGDDELQNEVSVTCCYIVDCVMPVICSSSV